MLLRGDVEGPAVLTVLREGRFARGPRFISSLREMSSKSTVSRVSSSGNVTERRLELQELLVEDFELELLSSGVVSDAASEDAMLSVLLADSLLSIGMNESFVTARRGGCISLMWLGLQGFESRSSC